MATKNELQIKGEMTEKNVIKLKFHNNNAI